jgi:two-component system phosphate regulon response regulator PhoB
MKENGPILVVDDEEDIRNLLLYQLKKEGLNAVSASNGQEALELARKSSPSMMILDLMLPGISGTEVCRRLRADPATADIPILMLSARSEEIDRVVGFEVGADDYVAKPFSIRELLLRIRAILRRSSTLEEQGKEQGKEQKGIHGLLKIDEEAHRVWVRGENEEELVLTATEFKLLNTLVRRPGRVFSRAQLLQDVWGMPPDLQTRTVDTHVKRLREKLLGAASHLETVRGVGYRFNPDNIAEPGSAGDTSEA